MNDLYLHIYSLVSHLYKMLTILSPLIRLNDSEIYYSPLSVAGVSGLTFRKDLYLASAQIYPPLEENKKPLTRLQERLMKKLGENAFPFYFELPPHCPARYDHYYNLGGDESICLSSYNYSQIQSISEHTFCVQRDATTCTRGHWQTLRH